ncbi:gliding motility-associated C-terminal domain-containing protein [Winogradskyella eckloniae]|nr:gliding motility-associated C-terminal domain-containing protein [Winogradskyella eckloniae]
MTPIALTKKLLIVFSLFICATSQAVAQDISLFQQFNGRYDYTAIGNTLNSEENGLEATCAILTSSTASLNLNSNQNIVAAYLYWAGSGLGDLNIKLNGITINAERSFADALDADRVFFAAYADVTSIILSEGNGDYTVSDFDLSGVIPSYCPTGTNFGGWAITIIYEDTDLPLNQLNVYDGLQSVPTFLSITLDNLNVLDNDNAKIGFVAWEGDSGISVNEQLTINGSVISNFPLNPANNAFNGTNSFTGASNLYNMDIDVYNIQNNINIGDTSATIQLTSGQDFVMINNIITVLNSQLPDATINTDDYSVNCGNNSIELYYTVYNTNSTAILPADTPIAFYHNNVLIGQSVTQNNIEINASESNSIVLTLPDNSDSNVTVLAVVDDDGTMSGIVTETNENNNTMAIEIELLVIPEIMLLPGVIGCNEGFETTTFNLFDALEGMDLIMDNISFFTNLEALENNAQSIVLTEYYTSMPETIYVRVESPPCYEIFQFDLIVENCPPYIPQGFSPNNDSYNDWFNIQGLYDIFTEHELQIYNRYGNLIFEGDNNKPWFGEINRGLNNIGNKVPVGTYYYILNLNDSNFQPSMGWVYVNY